MGLIVERHAEGGLADHPAAVDDDGAWSFADLSAASARAAGALAEAGVRRGDRVAVALRDGRPWLAAFLGAARLGAVPVPLDPRAGGERLAGILDDCEPAALVGDREAAVPGVRLVEPEALDDGVPRPVRPVHPEDLGYLVYSSGSTGRPKGAMHAHQDLRAGIETYAREVLALTPGDRCHSMARLFTSLGFGNGFFRVLGSGATAILSAGTLPTPRSVLGTVERHGVTVLTAVPTFWSQLARFLERHPDAGALAPVRLAVSSGDSLPPSVADRLRQTTGIDLIEGLGCSECSNIVISTRPGESAPGHARTRGGGRGDPARRRGGRPGGARGAGAPVDPQPLQHHRLLASRGRDPRAGVRAVAAHGRRAVPGGRRLPAPRPIGRPLQG